MQVAEADRRIRAGEVSVAEAAAELGINQTTLWRRRRALPPPVKPQKPAGNRRKGSPSRKRPAQSAPEAPTPQPAPAPVAEERRVTASFSYDGPGNRMRLGFRRGDSDERVPTPYEAWLDRRDRGESV